jgi:hypothetical protein
MEDTRAPNRGPEATEPSPEIARAKAVRRLVIDFGVGIVAPILCFAADPLVFRSDLQPAMYLPFKIVAYGCSGLAMAALAAVLLAGMSGAFLAGCLAAGAIVSAALGLALLPLSIAGLVVFIGALGLVPFLVAWVYGRRALEAWRARPPRGREAGILAAAGLLLVLLPPLLVQVHVLGEIRDARATILDSEDTDTRGAVEILTRYRSFWNADELVEIWQRETDEKRAARIADAYHRITGLDIEQIYLD